MSFKVNKLNITGYVNHTSKWNETRISFNNAKTKTNDLPRDINTYW